jgi:hypothetical protein
MGQGAGSLKMVVRRQGAHRWSWALLVYGQAARVGICRTRAEALEQVRSARRLLRRKWGRYEGAL